MITITIVEDDFNVCEALQTFLNYSDGFMCISAYSTIKEAEKYLLSDKPDVVLMDINLPDGTGVDLVHRLKQKESNSYFIMLTVLDDSEQVFSALSAGAVGYLTKNTSTEKILQAIVDVMDGGSPMSSNIARLVVQSFIKPKTDIILSNREESVLSLLSTGKSYASVGKNLFISENTIRTHIRNIYKKLEVNCRTEAIAKAINYKLI